ncbi:MAG: nucleoside-diphosphate kinase [candidate division WOR-3 bacterium]|nr:nucleoside-diphosphate kinase [candidate division WOR-3 bacterium]MCX7757299.1 nucleoside-diphosphate kinase [candidate division WOR-3 bacterium]MDW7987992.1 nucleoside-diphosphate kinase [candidate division WOR-3 bacterium]
MEQTLLVIKPDAVRAKHIGEIISAIEKNFEIVDIKYTRLTKLQAERFYAIHKGKPFYNDLIKFITSGPVVGILLQGENVQRRLREFIGATDPKKAQPNTIRARFGSSITENAVHASNPDEDPQKEIRIFFPKYKKKGKLE